MSDQSDVSKPKAYCEHCDRQIEASAKTCPHCGKTLINRTSPQQVGGLEPPFSH